MNIYYKDGEPYINVPEMEVQLNNLSKEEINELNNEAKEVGLEINNGKIKIIDEGKLQEINQDMNHLKQETDNVMDLPINESDKQSIQNIINQNDYDIKIDSDTTYLELVTGIESNLSNDSNFMNALSSEIEGAATTGYLTDELEGSSKYGGYVSIMNIVSNTVIGNLQDMGILDEYLATNSVTKFLSNTSEGMTALGGLLIVGSVEGGLAIELLYFSLAGEALPIPGARIVATLGVVLACIGILASNLLYTNENLDVIQEKGNSIFFQGKEIVIEYEDIASACSKMNDIIQTLVSNMKVNLNNLINTRDDHLRGAAMRLKTFYMQESTIDKFTDIAITGGEAFHYDFGIGKMNYTCETKWIEEDSVLVNKIAYEVQTINESSYEYRVTAYRYILSDGIIITGEVDAKATIHNIFYTLVANVIDFEAEVKNVANGGEVHDKYKRIQLDMNGAKCIESDALSKGYTFISEDYIGNTITNIDFFNNDTIDGLTDLESGAYRIDETDATIADIYSKS